MSKAIEETTKLQLIDIQKLQFSDKSAAEKAMLLFLRQYEDPAIKMVELCPKPESLNSISGFVTYANNERYFFKTHMEENEQISEYYNAETLLKAEYDIAVTQKITRQVGKQIALYEIVSFPTLFDLIKSAEDQIIRGTIRDGSIQQILNAQIHFDQKLFKIYESTMQITTGADYNSAPIHQLFYHRLDNHGRLGLFYYNKQLTLNKERALPFQELEALHWRINGIEYGESLADIIERSRTLLKPTAGPSVVGHGDAHNGNIFVDTYNNKLLLFDPAFAGRHDPLLDLAKPLFHNVFARWMYHPEQVLSEFDLSYSLNDHHITVEHSYQPSMLRLQILGSKIKHVLKPLVNSLQKSDTLRADWRTYLRSALFCCPFLTVNLFARHIPHGTLSERYQLPVRLLGLCMAVELGSITRVGNNPMTAIINEMFDDCFDY